MGAEVRRVVAWPGSCARTTGVVRTSAVPFAGGDRSELVYRHLQNTCAKPTSDRRVGTGQSPRAAPTSEELVVDAVNVVP